MQNGRTIQFVHIVDAFFAGGFAEVANYLTVDLDVDFFSGHCAHENEGVEEAVESFVVYVESHVFDDVLDEEQMAVLDGLFQALLDVPVAELSVLAGVEGLFELLEVAFGSGFEHGLSCNHELVEGLFILYLQFFDLLPDITRKKSECAHLNLHECCGVCFLEKATFMDIFFQAEDSSGLGTSLH